MPSASAAFAALMLGAASVLARRLSFGCLRAPFDGVMLSCSEPCPEAGAAALLDRSEPR